MFTKCLIAIFILDYIPNCYSIDWEPKDTIEPVNNKIIDDGLDEILNSMSPFSPIFISMNTCMFVSIFLGVISKQYKSALIKLLFTWFLMVIFTTHSMVGITTNLFCFAVIFALFIIGSCVTQ